MAEIKEKEKGDTPFTLASATGRLGQQLDGESNVRVEKAKVRSKGQHSHGQEARSGVYVYEGRI